MRMTCQARPFGALFYAPFTLRFVGTRHTAILHGIEETTIQQNNRGHWETVLCIRGGRYHNKDVLQYISVGFFSVVFLWLYCSLVMDSSIPMF